MEPLQTSCIFLYIKYCILQTSGSVTYALFWGVMRSCWMYCLYKHVTSMVLYSLSCIDPAEVTSISGPYQVFAGQPVTLTCTIAAIPAADVMWYKDGIAITPGGRIRIDTTADTNTRLIIDSATVEDNGMYQCFVSNDHGDDVGTISLQVHDNGKSALTVPT